MARGLEAALAANKECLSAAVQALKPKLVSEDVSEHWNSSINTNSGLPAPLLTQRRLSVLVFLPGRSCPQDMADFIQTEEFRLAGEEGEQRVFEAVKAAFAGRDTLGWWRYPLISEKSVGEPDILLLDTELGVVIIEVKSLQLEQIAGVSGYEWNMAPNAYFGRAQINPYQQAKAQLQVIMNALRGRVGLDRVSGRVVVATPMITRDEWDDASFNALLGATPMLFGDQLTPTKLMRALERTQLVAQGQALDEAQWAALTRAFGTSGNIPKPKNIAPVVVPPVPQTRAELVAERPWIFSRNALPKQCRWGRSEFGGWPGTSRRGNDKIDSGGEVGGSSRKCKLTEARDPCCPGFSPLSQSSPASVLRGTFFVPLSTPDL